MTDPILPQMSIDGTAVLARRRGLSICEIVIANDYAGCDRRATLGA
ncbi:MAG: hypothetical protein V4595_00270 [Pseudomonadota bacterium]